MATLIKMLFGLDLERLKRHGRPVGSSSRRVGVQLEFFWVKNVVIVGDVGGW